MKILLLGANGQVGWELQRSLAPLGQMKACDRHALDLGNFEGLRACTRDYRPGIIVNAAAYTAVEKAESEQDKACRINAEAVALLADEAKQLNAWFIHYSTDYVFDGTKSNAYLETDETNPQSVYGKTKLQGEEAIKVSECNHLIFRTSWIFAARGANFAKTMIRLAKEQEELKVVNDQFGVPTSAELIADVTALCLNQIAQEKNPIPNVTGTYHLTPTGKTSWHGFAQFVIAEAYRAGETFRLTPEKVLPISTSEYPMPVKRPSNSQLDTQKLRDTFNLYLPPWQTHVKRLITEIHSEQTI
jgi:dTDP-4-dehydrorhamnose reductase